MKRYIVNISFKQPINIGIPKTETIAEEFTTLIEAKTYKDIIDETVAKACIVDRVTGKVVEWWIK